MDNPQYTPDYCEGTLALHAGRPADSIASFERVPIDSPCWAMAQGNVGQALVTMGQGKQAEDRLRQTLAEIDRRGCPYPPAHVQFVRNLGEAIGLQGRWVEAVLMLEEARALAGRLVELHPGLSEALVREAAYALNSAGAALIHLWRFDRAVPVLERARDLLRQCPEARGTGEAEILTNLATAFDAMGQQTRAQFAIEEATDLARRAEDADQFFRILMVAHRLGLEVGAAEHVLDIVETEAGAALERGRPGVAYLRYALGASIAARRGDAVGSGLRMVANARVVESQIDAADPSLPKLRLFEAMLLRSSGADHARYTHVLIDGAHEWIRRVGRARISADFRVTAADLHYHVRLLAGCLLEAGRAEESLVAFETGRALGYAVEVDPSFTPRVVDRNPFDRDAGSVNLALLRDAQQGLHDAEVAVVLTVIPPHMVAFLVDPLRVETVGMRVEDLDGLDTAIRVIPHELAKQVGQDAIPASLLAWARKIAEKVGARRVTSLIPYDALHIVPWRAVLRASGLHFRQLAFPTGFNLLMRRGKAPGREVQGQAVRALGYGHAGAIDLATEAEQFVGPLGPRATLVSGCTAAHVREALGTDAVVLLSCHGKAVPQDRGTALRLSLADGEVQAEEVFPECVPSPLVILSACDSGVYTMAWGDYPLGAGPSLLRRGAQAVIGARFPVRADFAGRFFPLLGRRLSGGGTVEAAFADTLTEMEGADDDLWRDLACLELLRAV